MTIALLAAAIGFFTLSSSALAESTSNVQVTNDVNSSSSSSSQNNCHNHVSVTINGQNKTVDNNDCTDLNVKASDTNGKVDIKVNGQSQSSSSATPQPPKPPTAPTSSALHIPNPPTAPSFPDLNPKTAQISQQINQFTQHLQQEVASFLHNIFHF